MLSLLLSPTLPSQEHFHDHDYKKCLSPCFSQYVPCADQVKATQFFFPAFSASLSKVVPRFLLEPLPVPLGSLFPPIKCLIKHSLPFRLCYLLLLRSQPCDDYLGPYNRHPHPSFLSLPARDFKWFYCSSLPGPQSSYTAPSFIPTQSYAPG